MSSNMTTTNIEVGDRVKRKRSAAAAVVIAVQQHGRDRFAFVFDAWLHCSVLEAV